MPEPTVNHIAVIIPCFNTPPAYIQQAIDSVTNSNIELNYKIIIVNDGSVNNDTQQFLSIVNDINIKVINQENKGLASARNTGINNSIGEYLVFLDSDDRLKPDYVKNGTAILQQQKDTAVVYANAEAFGDGSRPNFVAKPFDITSLLLTNHVPSCVVMRRSVWKAIGGFDETMHKYEDWEFWIRVYKAGWKFHFMENAMFEYRIHKKSLLGESSNEDFEKAVAYIYQKHWDLVYKIYHQLFASRIIYHNDMKKPFRSFFKYLKQKL